MDRYILSDGAVYRNCVPRRKPENETSIISAPLTMFYMKVGKLLHTHANLALTFEDIQIRVPSTSRYQERPLKYTFGSPLGSASQ